MQRQSTEDLGNKEKDKLKISGNVFLTNESEVNIDWEELKCKFANDAIVEVVDFDIAGRLHCSLDTHKGQFLGIKVTEWVLQLVTEKLPETIFRHNETAVIFANADNVNVVPDVTSNEDHLINMKSIKITEAYHSEKVPVGSFIKIKGRPILGQVTDSSVLNGTPCIAFNQTNPCLTEKKELFVAENFVEKKDSSKLKYFRHNVILPSSVCVLRSIDIENIKVKSKVQFRLTDLELFRGTVLWTGQLNGSRYCVAVQLDSKHDLILDCYDICKCAEFSFIANDARQPIVFVPADVLQTITYEKFHCHVNDINLFIPNYINEWSCSWQGKKMVFLKCHGNRAAFKVMWRGTVNNENCIGVELPNGTERGTNGTFASTKLFDCKNGHGTLIQERNLKDCCVADGHMRLKYFHGQIIDVTNVCCSEELDNSHLDSDDVKVGDPLSVNIEVTVDYGICRWIGLINGKEVLGVQLSRKDRFELLPPSNMNLFPDGDGPSFLIELQHCLRESLGFVFCETLNLYIVNGFDVQNVEAGKTVDMQILCKISGKSEKLYVKWKGVVDKTKCVGCELALDTEYGTDGTYGGQQLFNCQQKRGVLVPCRQFPSFCVDDLHKTVEKHSESFWNNLRNMFSNVGSIKDEWICCVERLKRIETLPKAIIGSRIAHKDGSVGTCKWLGKINGCDAVGVELENETSNGTNGRFSCFDIFECGPKRGLIFFATDDVHEFEKEKIRYVWGKIVDVEQIWKAQEVTSFSDSQIHLGRTVRVTVPVGDDDNPVSMVGEVKWLGIIRDEKCVGIDLEIAPRYGMNGIVKDDVRFNCKDKHGILMHINSVKLCW